MRRLIDAPKNVARMLIREMGRQRFWQARPLDETPEPSSAEPESGSDLEDRIEALRQSLDELSQDDRFLILNYYQGDKSERIKTRKMLSEQFGLGSSTLRVRALRIGKEASTLRQAPPASPKSSQASRVVMHRPV